MTASSAKPPTVARWRAVVSDSMRGPAGANVVLLTLSIVAGLLSLECGNGPATPAVAAHPTPVAAAHPTPVDTAPAQQRCVPGTTQSSDRFSLVHGCITYSDGSEIWAFDPNHPANRISLGTSKGVSTIAWSRDGSRLLLTETSGAGADTKQDLYVMNADGSQKRLTIDGLSYGGSFSPDGARVAFVGGDESIYVVDVKGGTPRLIAKSYMAWWLGSPAWSPDGSRIAYTVYLEGGPEGMTYQIWTVNPDRSDARRLLDIGECGAGGCTGGLAWSPDGSMLAFHSHRSDPMHKKAIYVVHADGSGLSRINDHGVSPTWSPDGSRLAFIQYDVVTVANGGTVDLMTMAPDGSDVRKVEEVLPPFGWAWNPVG